MRRGPVFWTVFGGWAVLCLLSVAVPALTPVTGDGFGRGLNRVALFVMYQAGATVLAAVLLGAARAQPTRVRRWLARTPALLVLAQLVVFGSVILWGRFGAGTA